MILDAIHSALDVVNGQLPKERQIAKSPTTVLRGEAGTLDSLALVNLIVAVEEQISERMGIQISLADAAMGMEASDPLASVESLSQYVAKLVERAGSAR